MVGRPFVTPANERSFSGLCDQVALETGRPGNLLTIISKARMTLRECQTLGLFPRDRVEEQFTTDATPYIWTRPSYFRSVGAAKYMTACVYPKLLLPGKSQTEFDYYFYASDDYYVFVNAMLGETLSLLNYYWVKPLLYFSRLGTDTATYPGGPYALRKAYYDLLLDKWQYLNGTNDAYVDTTGNVDTDTLYRKNSSHWLVEDWYDMIVDGTKAKIFALYSDERAPITYGSYKQSQILIQNTVSIEGEAATQGIAS